MAVLHNFGYQLWVNPVEEENREEEEDEGGEQMKLCEDQVDQTSANQQPAPAVIICSYI